MKRGRTRDIDEIGRLAVEHQAEIVVHACTLEQTHRGLAALADRIVDSDDADAGAREPSREMSARGDFAETGDCSAQLHIQARAIPSSSRSYWSGARSDGNRTRRWAPAFS